MPTSYKNTEYVCVSCGYKTFYPYKSKGMMIDCSNCGTPNMTGTVQSTDQFPIVLGEKCECTACKNAPKTALKGSCPKCGIQCTSGVNQDTVMCVCGTKFKIQLLEDAEFMTQHCPTCNKAHYNKIGAMMQCSCNTEYQMVQSSSDGELYYGEIKYKSKNAVPVPSYICTCGKILDGKTGDTIYCNCGKIYKITGYGIWKDILEAKIYSSLCAFCNAVVSGAMGTKGMCKCGQYYCCIEALVSSVTVLTRHHKRDIFL